MFGAIGIDRPIRKIMSGIAGLHLWCLRKWEEVRRVGACNVGDIELDTFKPALDASIETTRPCAAALLSSRRW